MSPPVVAIVGTRYGDFGIEQAALAPTGAVLRSGAGESADDLVAVAGDADVVLAGSGPRFDAGTLARLSCRGIVRYGVGVDSIDLGAARARGMCVARVADYGTEAVAVHALTLVLAAVRRLHEADAHVRAGGWGFGDLRPLAQPSALVAGVVGYGRIGRRVAELLAGVGFRVAAHDALAPVAATASVAALGLDELLAEADVVTLHAPGPPGGAPLLDRAALARLKPGAVLVNTARGGLVDAAALADGLRVGRPRVAALDVFPHEPPTLDAFAGVLHRLILTPHMAWYTEDSERTMRTKAAESARRLLMGERPDDVVVDRPAAGARP